MVLVGDVDMSTSVRFDIGVTFVGDGAHQHHADGRRAAEQLTVPRGCTRTCRLRAVNSRARLAVRARLLIHA